MLLDYVALYDTSKSNNYCSENNKFLAKFLIFNNSVFYTLTDTWCITFYPNLFLRKTVQKML